MTEAERLTRLVCIGSSAGGIEALSSLVAGFDTDFPAPIVIAQHLDPNRPTRLREILARKTSLPVRELEEHEKLTAGTIYVVPTNRNVEVTDHSIRLHRDQESPKPSIDLLLRSAAEVFGDGLIAVILSGTGSDGAAAAYEVKRLGGTVIIQNPQTAKYPGLPESLAPTTVDLVANLEDIPALLLELLTGTFLRPEPDETLALRSLLAELQEHQGIDFRNYKRPTIMRRLQRRMAATGQSSIADYVHYIQSNPEEYAHLVSSFLIKVTEFFRDPEVYAHLRDVILPGLIETARERDHEIRIWSAGCATGEEAYSLAILLAELLGDELGIFTVRIFATDLDTAAVEFARRGIFSAPALGGVPPELVTKYFNHQDGHFQIKKIVRSLTIFGQHDLTDRAPFPRIDLLLCRNVLIYFTTELQRHVLQLVAFSLRDGGFLVLGKAETTTPLSEYFVQDNATLKTYRRRGGRGPVATSRAGAPPRNVTARAPGARESLVEHQMHRLQREAQRTPTLRERSESILHHLPVGLVTIDRSYDIQSINTAARAILGIHGTAVGDDFVHLAASLPSRELRALIDATFRDGGVPRLDDVPLQLGSDDGSTYVRIESFLNENAEGENALTVSLLISDTSDEVTRRQALEAENASLRSAAEQANEQVRHLHETQRELLTANQELSTLNMELRSANEEFMVGNEELQAASEEVETLNEELQATNEELETLNEELQATVEELNTTNDDLQSRSGELQELAVSLEAERHASETERARLSAVLLHMADAVLVADGHRETLLVNAAYDRMFGKGQTFMALREDGTPFSQSDTPQSRTARGESFSVEFTVRDSRGALRRMEANGEPIGGDDESLGGVLVIRDITERATPPV